MTTSSRIVNVSSIAAKYSTKLDPNNLNKHPEAGAIMAENHMYSSTKLCNILFTNELAKKLDGTGVTTNSLHPGGVQTEFLRSTFGLFGTILRIIQTLFSKTPEEGAQTTIFVALSKDIEGISGELFDNCRKIEMYDSAKDVVLAKKVWQNSEELVKLTNDEKI